MRVGSFVKPKKPRDTFNLPKNLYLSSGVWRVAKIVGDKISVVFPSGKIELSLENKFFDKKSFDFVPFFKKGEQIKLTKIDCLPGRIRIELKEKNLSFKNVTFEVLMQRYDEIRVREIKENPIKFWVNYTDLCLVNKGSWPSYL